MENSQGNKENISNVRIGADGDFVSSNGYRIPDLHPSDPYWIGKDNYFRRPDGSYDDERNDMRPDDEKYKSKPVIMVAMLILLIGLIALVIHIFNQLPS